MSGTLGLYKDFVELHLAIKIVQGFLFDEILTVLLTISRGIYSHK